MVMHYVLPPNHGCCRRRLQMKAQYIASRAGNDANTRVAVVVIKVVDLPTNQAVDAAGLGSLFGMVVSPGDADGTDVF
jgi:hypothetical protein